VVVTDLQRVSTRTANFPTNSAAELIHSGFQGGYSQGSVCLSLPNVRALPSFRARDGKFCA